MEGISYELFRIFGVVEREEKNLCLWRRDFWFSICGEVMRVGNRKHVLRMKKFMKERQYEFQIETSSFCNAQ